MSGDLCLKRTAGAMKMKTKRKEKGEVPVIYPSQTPLSYYGCGSESHGDLNLYLVTYYRHGSSSWWISCMVIKPVDSRY